MAVAPPEPGPLVHARRPLRGFPAVVQDGSPGDGLQHWHGRTGQSGRIRGVVLSRSGMPAGVQVALSHNQPSSTRDAL